MPKIVSFIIQKGGCGKTTTTVNTASYLARQGFKILAVDMDPQGNMTQHFGIDTESLDITIKQLLMREEPFEKVVIRKQPNLHILPNNIESATLEFLLYKNVSREYALRDALEPIKNEYDFILIDCPPNLGIFSINALTASTEFVLVVSPEFFPMKAIKPLYETYLLVKNRLNHSLTFKGVLMTMCDFRTRHSQEVRKILEKNFPHKLYKSFIRYTVSLKEASSVGKSIFEYDPTSPGAFDYQSFSEEFIRDHHRIRQKRAYYDRKFMELPAEEQQEILKFAKNNLSNFNRTRIEALKNEPVLREALIIERNKILEKLYPYRENSVIEEYK